MNHSKAINQGHKPRPNGCNLAIVHGVVEGLWPRRRRGLHFAFGVGFVDGEGESVLEGTIEGDLACK
eukprot:SAG31_NODE_32986_length_349_cov_0.928000_2_plen_66_part_01